MKNYKYKWNTIIDDKTCPECAALDGMLFTKAEVNDGRCPPVHKKDEEHSTDCRCYLTWEKET